MTELTVDELAEGVATGALEVSDVPLARAVEVADELAEGGRVEPLEQLADRVFPRLLKKERLEEIEGLWLTCCTAGVFPLKLMLRTAERLHARGREAAAAELAMVLAEALDERGRAEDALEVLRTGLDWAAADGLVDTAEGTLERLFGEASNLEAARRQLRREVAAGEGGAALRRAERALRFAPGTFLQWLDTTVGQVVSTDGVTAQIRHPSGSVERRTVDEEPPPKVLSHQAHEVLRLFAPEELRQRWSQQPTECLASVLEEQSGYVPVPGLEAILVPRVLDQADYERALAQLKIDCGLGRPERPRYDSKRRMFVAPGCEPPKPKRTKKRAKPAEPRERSRRAPVRATTASAPLRPSLEQPRWVDLTALPEVRALIAHVEKDVAELTRELNVDLPVRLEEARAHGDLRENAEYDAAKERLRFVQARVDQLRSWLAQLHELSQVRLIPGKVTAMSELLVSEEGSDEERRLRLVPAELREPKAGDVSIGTPYGKALLGKEAGDVVVVRLPRRTERLELLQVIDPDQVSGAG